MKYLSVIFLFIFNFKLSRENIIDRNSIDIWNLGVIANAASFSNIFKLLIDFPSVKAFREMNRFIIPFFDRFSVGNG